MLQQTRVQAMLPLYSAFLLKFPFVEDLAKAELEDVLSAWKGLGYYSRAKNLWKGAQTLVRDFNGAFPRDLQVALSIPGIGPYTARAVLSIALGEPYAVLDGNVKRVLSRVFLYEKNILGSHADKDLQTIADQFLNPKDPGSHNEALMELGATICLPLDPKCLLCPLVNDCEARKRGLTKDLPIRKKENAKVSVNLIFLVVKNKRGEILLTKTKHRKFFKTVWALPHVLIRKSDSAPSPDDLPSFESALLSRFSFSEELGGVSHSITNHAIKAFIRKTGLKEDQEYLSFQKERKAELLKDWEEGWFSIDSISSKFPSSLTKKLEGFFV